MIPVEIRPSPIHGKGVFATARLPSGIVIPDNIPPDEYVAIDPKSSDDWKDGVSAVMRPDGLLLVYRNPSRDFESWTDHINHSYDPNVVMVGEHMRVVTIRAIDAGEEITLDYRECLHPDDPDLALLP